MFKNPTTRSKLGWLLIDMLVVFLGVYAAFALDSYRQMQQQKQREETIIKSLLVEFSESQKTLDAMLPQINTLVDSLTIAYETGMMPRLPFMQAAISHRSQYWETMMQMGGFDVLDIDFVLKMEDYHAQVETLQETSKKFEQLCIQLILPQADAEISEFYNTETQKLKHRYSWYFPTLKNFKNKFHELHAQNRELLKYITTRTSTKHVP